MNDTENKHPCLSLDDILDRLKDNRPLGLPAQQAALHSAKVIVCSGSLEPDLERQAVEAEPLPAWQGPFSLAQFTADVRFNLVSEP